MVVVDVWGFLWLYIFGDVVVVVDDQVVVVEVDVFDGVWKEWQEVVVVFFEKWYVLQLC